MTRATQKVGQFRQYGD